MDQLPDYSLARKLNVSKDGVRCVLILPNNFLVSGNSDGSVVIWKSSKEEQSIRDLPMSIDQDSSVSESDAKTVISRWLDFSDRNDLKMHNNSVMCLSNVMEKYFVTGGMDKNMFVVDSETGETVVSFVNAHSNAVCSVRFLVNPKNNKCDIKSTDGILLSGCWSGQLIARTLDGLIIWSLRMSAYGVCLNVISGGLEGADTVQKNTVFGDRKMDIVVVGNQEGVIQLVSPDGVLISKFPESHKDIIRKIVNVRTLNREADPRKIEFLSCSNDCEAKLWSMTSDGKLSLETVLTGHDSFVFSCDVIQNGGKKIIATGSEDKSIKIWVNGSCTQTIRFCNTVWDVFFGSGFEFLYSACADGYIRIYSNDPQKYGTIQEADLSTEGNQVDIKRLPGIAEMASMEAKEGTFKVFRRGEEGVAFQYANGQWVEIGVVTGGVRETKTKAEYEGDNVFPIGSYDFIFDVEMNGSMSKLPVNISDVPMHVAENFCARQNISNTNIPEIVEFINKNTENSRKHAVRYPTANGQKKQNRQKLISSFITQEYLFFKTVPYDRMKEKITKCLECDVNAFCVTISPIDKESIIHLIDQMKNDFPLDKHFLEIDHLLYKKLLSPENISECIKTGITDICVILDVTREYLLKGYKYSRIPFSVSFLTGISHLLYHEGCLETYIETSCCVCAMKLVCNLFSNEKSRCVVCSKDGFETVIQKVTKILEILRKREEPSKGIINLVSALSVLLLNYSIAAGECHPGVDGDILIVTLLEQLEISEFLRSEEPLNNSLVSLGCCGSAGFQLGEKVKECLLRMKYTNQKIEQTKRILLESIIG